MKEKQAIDNTNRANERQAQQKPGQGAALLDQPRWFQ
jgi:hypothetical protein